MISLHGDAMAQRAEAFCALRDPNREIRMLSPKYESYDSVIRKISQEERVKILKEVPFPIHFDELGQRFEKGLVLGAPGALGIV